MFYLLCVALFLPLLGFLVLTASSQIIARRATGILACSTVCMSFLSFLTLLLMFQGWMEHETWTLFKWIHVGSINGDFTLHLDPLSLVMGLIITGVGFLIHVYSIGYMDHDEDFVRYFACMNFFVFGMLLLVLGGDFLTLFVGWEGVGLASYLLIGFYYDRPKAAGAATKAFVMNRIGDLGLLIGIILTFYLFGTTNIEEVSEQAGVMFAVGAPMMTLLSFLYFVGAVGKSAQLPLYTWLPDAMEGPTPVSALIHAATMVTAGVYLVVRMHEVFLLAPTTLYFVGAVGGVTSLFASLCALGQTDLKRVLAYSTVSQLGLMFLACGIGAFYSAMFHLTMHAFVKALLFLSAGHVVHMMHGTTEMGQMGGLSKIFTKTNWLFLIGALALSGIPPLATFFSKDLILEEEFLAGYDVLFYISLIASILTGVYLMRAYYLTFCKGPNGPAISRDVKEAPNIMLIPVSILAFLSIAGGFLGFGISGSGLPPLEEFIQAIGITPTERGLSHGFHFSWEMVMAVGGSLLGVVGTFFFYRLYKNRLGEPLPLLNRSFYIDELYWKGIAVPLKNFSKLVGGFFEPKVFEGSIQGASIAAEAVAKGLQKAQSGQIRSYIAWMSLGFVLLMVYLVL